MGCRWEEKKNIYENLNHPVCGLIFIRKLVAVISVMELSSAVNDRFLSNDAGSVRNDGLTDKV